MTIDWRSYDEVRGSGRPHVVVSTNRFSHAAHALDELLGDDEVERALAPFACARVDCDERPDVDVPLQRRLGRAVPSWPLIARYDGSGALLELGSHLNRRALLELLRRPPPAPLPPAPPPPRATVDEALGAIYAAYDRRHGGFDAPPRPPRPALLDLLLALGPRPDDPAFDPPRMALRTLDALGQGGIHDQLGGGFHVYSTDERWVVPHFEKRAGDQAALLGTFARAAAHSGRSPAAGRRPLEPSLRQARRYAAIARRIIAYVECRLALDGGGYAAAEDADVGAWDDGSFYTWTVDEARAVLDADELRAAQPYFDLYGRGELHSDPTRNVLFIAASVDDVARELGRPAAEVQRLLARARDKLLAARVERPQPAVDVTPYAGVAARMARAYLEAEAALGVVSERERAIYTLERLYAARAPDGGIDHVLGDEGRSRGIRWLADHAELGLAALRAWEATGERRHLDIARATADHLLDGWWHPAGGFRARPGDDDRPFRDDEDGAGASANAVAGALLWGLGLHTGEARFGERARALCEALVPLACGAAVAGAGLIYLRTVTGIGQ